MLPEVGAIKRDRAQGLEAEWKSKHPKRSHVAYLCMEYGVRDDLDIYAGGLGILAGDVVKTAYDHDLPVVSIGILWDEGYVKQIVDKSGHVADEFPKLDRKNLKPVSMKPFEVPVGDEDIKIAAFTVEGCGEKLFLLEPVDPPHRAITRRLYQGGGPSDRIAQEVILGVGGVRLMRHLGMDVQFFHFNEGHAAFAGLELIREKMTGSKKLPFEDALAATKKECVFTTHTPVKAGNETHQMSLILDTGLKRLGFTTEQLKKVGGGSSETFGMTEAGFAMSCRVNAVSQLHRETAAKIWNDESIIAISNGVHVPSWQDEAVREGFEKLEKIKSFPTSIEEDPLWVAHMAAKKKLISHIESQSGVKLDPNQILIGFARRAATYKRHSLLFRRWRHELKVAAAERKKDSKDKDSGETSAEDAKDKDGGMEEFSPAEETKSEKALIAELEKGSLQLVFSGKAHPADGGGKFEIEVIHQRTEKSPEKAKVVYLDGYNMELGRLLTRGCDVWLNTPIKPMEACGTSGMKAAMNGVLNCSILDGWWPEMCQHGENGWQIERDQDSEECHKEEDDRIDERDGEWLRALILDEILPAYNDEKKLKWRKMMAASIRDSQVAFSSERMMADYGALMYGDKSIDAKLKKKKESD